MAAATVEDGFAGLLTCASVFGFFTGLYAAITGKRSWAMLPGGRKFGVGVLTVSLVLMVIGTRLINAQELGASAASKNSPATVCAWTQVLQGTHQ